VSTPSGEPSFAGPPLEGVRSSDPAVRQARELLRREGFEVSDHPVDGQNETPQEERDLQPSARGRTLLDDLVPLEELLSDLRSRLPSMMPPAVAAGRRSAPPSLGRFPGPQDVPLPNLPLSPSVSQWLEEQSQEILGRDKSGKPKRSAYAKGVLPRLPRVHSRYVPQDVPTLFESPVLPTDWYRVVHSRSNSSPSAYSLTSREVEDAAAAAGRDLSVLSQLDWLAAGSSDLLGRLEASPQCRPLLGDLYLLDRYCLEMARSIELLGQTASARYANAVWRMRDGHLSRLHSSVPSHTREALRGASLSCPSLFPEAVVSVTAECLKADVHMQSMSDSLKLVRSASSKRGDSRKRPASFSPPRPPAKKVLFRPRTPSRFPGPNRGRGRGSGVPRGSKTSKGKGRGKRSS